MSRPIRSRRRSAAESCNRIDLVPSRRVAASGAIWLMFATALTLQSAMPWPGHLAVAALVWTAGTWAIRIHVMLAGARAVRAIEWPVEAGGTYFVHLGPNPRRLPALPVGCGRQGMAWFLRFRTPEGTVGVFVDAGIQDPHAVRRLGRRLFANPGAGPKAVPAARRRQADTIAPKV